MDRPAADASVRDATAADATAIGEVQAAAWRASYRSVLPAATLESLQAAELAEVWRDAIVRPPSGSHRVLVAVEAGEVVGFVAVAPSDGATPEVGEVAALVVSPGAQRSGHGSRLLNAAVARLRDEGFERVETWVLDGDGVRRGFFAGAGFADDGGHRTFATGPEAAELREVRMAAALRDEA
jgi:GNAT superfamily N-acetyltransferase